MATSAGGGASRPHGLILKLCARGRTLVAAAGVVGVLLVLYRDILTDLVAQWMDDPNYSHGFLVPFFAGFIVWKRRADLACLPMRGSWLGVPVLLTGIGGLLLGEVGAEDFLKRSSLVVVLAGLALFHFGVAVSRVLALPLLFLMFMVPLPATVFYAVAFPLQHLAARNAAWTLDLLGVPALLDGNVIHLSQISLGITEACSGIRSLISLLAGAVAWAHLAFPGSWDMLALVASTVPITILANSGRVVATGLIGQWFGAEYAQGAFHSVSGWIVFLLALVCLLAVDIVIRLVRRYRSRPVS